MATLVKGSKIRIVELGPKDSWSRGDISLDATPLGKTATLVEIHDNLGCTPGFATVVVDLDEPLLNYLLRITLFEAKIERIEPNESNKNTCI